jgi:hypothetical protein
VKRSFGDVELFDSRKDHIGHTRDVSKLADVLDFAEIDVDVLNELGHIHSIFASIIEEEVEVEFLVVIVGGAIMIGNGILFGELDNGLILLDDEFFEIGVLFNELHE